MSKQIQDVQQTRMKLPYFNEDVPVLYLSDGTPYVPVVVLCQILGLRSNSCIRRCRKLLLWSSARKLPLKTEKWGKRIVWCLPFGALPVWFCGFNMKALVPERRKQLLEVSYELAELPNRIHLEMLTHYRQVRRFLFWFLMKYDNTDAELSQLVQQIQPFIDGEDTILLEELVAEGQSIINEAIDIARKMIHEQERIPIVDAYKVDHYGSVTEIFSLPLLPIISQVDEKQLIECMEMLKEWHQDITMFITEH